MMRRVLAFSVMILLVADRADAMVYSWRDGEGVFHFTNQTDNVPTGQIEGLHTFSEAPSPPPPDGAPAGPPPALDDDPRRGYAQGLESGLRMGQEQFGAADGGASANVELPPPPPVAVAQPPAVVVGIVPRSDQGLDDWNSCGFGACPSYIVGPALFGRPGFHRGRFPHGQNRFGRGTFLHAGRGMHGGRSSGRH